MPMGVKGKADLQNPALRKAPIVQAGVDKK